MIFASAVLGAWLCFRTAGAIPVDVLRSTFTNSSNHWDAQTTISFPDSTEFVDATERWDTDIAPGFAIAITPATEEDVVRAVTISRSIDLPFLATGGRHSISTTLGTLVDGLAIDLSALNSVVVDAAAATLTVGGGTRFRDIMEPVWNAGYQMPTGSCACPGMVGATVGAGVGRYQGVNGLIIDSLLSVRLVTAEGQLVDVSADSNPDLFWAVRGAAANFGIITSATYQLHPQINNGQVLNADFILPASSNGSYFDLLQSLQDTIPAELATISIVAYSDALNEAQILVNWVYIGPEDKGRELIAPLFDLNPVASSVSMTPWDKLQETAAWGLGAGAICDQVQIKGYGANYRTLSSSTYQSVFQKVNDFYADYPDGRSTSIEWEIFSPEAVQAVSVDATAYPWRDSLGYVIISFGWGTPETEQAGEQAANEIRSSFAATSGYDDLAVYVSYAHGDETSKQVYGNNLPRLTELKKKWDPNNVFRFHRNLLA